MILFLLCILLPPTMITAQTSAKRIIEDNKEWIIHTQVVYPYAPLITHKMKIEGDTIVNGEARKRLINKIINEYGGEREFFEYCHQEGEIFYRNGVKMFDFGLQVGDTFHVDKYEVLAVTEVSTIALNDGVSRKCLSMGVWYSDSIISPAQDKWIEGIGSLKMGIYDNSITKMGVKEELQSVISNNEYIYKREVKSEYPHTPVVIKGCPTLENPSVDDKIDFVIELGIFLGNDTYKQQVDSIVENTIYTSGTYNRYWPGVALFNQTKNLTLGKLKDGDYTLHHNIRGLNGSAPTNIDTTFTYTFTVVKANQIECQIIKKLIIRATSSTLLCTSPTAVKLEVYTMDAVKVGEADFANGEATVKVGKVPATYLYIVTYPDGRRESGKVAVKD